MSQKVEVGIIGAGQWGSTLSLLASRNNVRVTLYDQNQELIKSIQSSRKNIRYLPEKISFPENIFVTSDIEIVTKPDLLLFVIPSKAIRNLCQTIKPFIRNEHMILHGTKGLEPHTFLRMSEIISQETNCKKVGVLSGPNIAIELALGQPGATVIASANKNVIESAQQIFASSQFRVYGNEDLLGVEWAGSLKNILAIAAGINNGLGFGSNVLSMLITRGLSEMSRVIQSIGGHSNTLIGLAGIGDIITTCTSPLSRNFRAGQMLTKGKTRTEIEKELAMTVEGFNTIEVIAELAEKKNLDLPITQALNKIIRDNQPIPQAIQQLMERPFSYEFQYN